MNNNHSILKFYEYYKSTSTSFVWFIFFFSIPLNFIFVNYFELNLMFLLIPYYLFANKINFFFCLIYFRKNLNKQSLFVLKKIHFSCKQFISLDNLKNTIILKHREIFLEAPKYFVQLSSFQSLQLEKKSLMSKILRIFPFIKQHTAYSPFIFNKSHFEYYPYKFFQHIETNKLYFCYDSPNEYDDEFEKIFSQNIIEMVISEIKNIDDSGKIPYSKSYSYYLKHDELYLQHKQKLRVNSLLNSLNDNKKTHIRKKI